MKLFDWFEQKGFDRLSTEEKEGSKSNAGTATGGSSAHVPPSSVLIPTHGTEMMQEEKSTTPEGDGSVQRMTRAQAADALVALSKSKPRVMRRKECAVKIPPSSKKKTTPTQSTSKESVSPASKKGKSTALTFKDSDAEVH